MVCSALYVLDQKGKILISRNYRGDVSRGIADSFSRKIQESDGNDLKPVYTEGGYTFAWIKHSNVLLLAVTRRNSNITMMLYFLHKLTDVMREYFGDVEEESIRDNFVILYELLDETMDFGYPQIAEAGVLKEYITTESHVLAREKVKPPQAVTNMVSWRPEGITHPKEEVYLDVEEKLHLIVSAGGKVMSSEIEGALKMKCYLSGMPNLKLGLNDKLMFQATGRRGSAKAVELEDVKFHQCVRLAQFEHDRTISFTPPDGEFELMSYRLNTHVKPLIWVETVVEKQGRSRLQYSVKVKSNYKRKTAANGVEILIPVPPDVDSPAFRATVGRVTYVPDLECLKWTIPQLLGGKEVLMRAHLGLPSVEAEDDAEENAWRTKPIRVRFEIPYFTVSGLQVRYLRVTEASGYQATPWVRYVTLNGDYLLRMG